MRSGCNISADGQERWPPTTSKLRTAVVLYRCDTTGVPTLTLANRSKTSSFIIRIQPADAKVPIEPGLFVPCIAYLSPDRVRAAAPIGFAGEPPGTTCLGGELRFFPST